MRRRPMPKRRKTIELRVTVSCPTWLSRSQAKKEVRALINQQAFYGHRRRPVEPFGPFDEIDTYNFRARKVE